MSHKLTTILEPHRSCRLSSVTMNEFMSSCVIAWSILIRINFRLIIPFSAPDTWHSLPSDTAFCSYMVVRYTHYQRYKHHYVIKQKHTMQKAHISEISAS
jgi:hypothetical protein